MDRLVRTPLLLEFSLPGAQRKMPGGFAKHRTKTRRQRAVQPGRDGTQEKIGRRLIQGNVRGTQKRDDHPALSKRRAARTRGEARPTVISHLHKKRTNPQAKPNRLRRRGNPQAPAKTQVRESPSKLERRPTLPKTPKFFSRGDLMRGRRL